MKVFECQKCSHQLYFDNTSCERCASVVGYAPTEGTILTLVPENGSNVWRPFAPKAADQSYRQCGNAQHGVCNWLIPSTSTDRLCTACGLNHVIPNLTVPANVAAWRKLELAKHSLVYSLHRFCLPVVSKQEDQATGLAFNFVSDADGVSPAAPLLTTGHDHGLITINLAEADEAERERRRLKLGEPYRTLLGHFRHEVGHYYWERLVQNQPVIEEFRKVFGDDRQDYGEALKRHYANGAPADWRNRFVSSYASAHPFEDWAETWAHYLHTVDTLETAYAFGLSIRPKGKAAAELSTAADFDSYNQPDFDSLMAPWLPLTLAINSLNRSMGQPDLYPFVVGSEVMVKMEFIHRLVHGIRPAAEEPKAPLKRDARTWPNWLRRRSAISPPSQPVQ